MKTRRSDKNKIGQKNTHTDISLHIHRNNKKKQSIIRFNSKPSTKALVFGIIIFLLVLNYHAYIKRTIIIALFIGCASVSKLYQRFINVSIGINLILFSALLISLVYQDLTSAMLVGWVSIVMADFIAKKFSYYSFFSLINITVTILISSLFFGRHLIISLIALTIIYEALDSLLYYLAGSSPHNILTYATSHFIFNMFLILSLANKLSVIMS